MKAKKIFKHLFYLLALLTLSVGAKSDNIDSGYAINKTNFNKIPKGQKFSIFVFRNLRNNRYYTLFASEKFYNEQLKPPSNYNITMKNELKNFFKISQKSTIKFMYFLSKKESMLFYNKISQNEPPGFFDKKKSSNFIIKTKIIQLSVSLVLMKR